MDNSHSFLVRMWRDGPREPWRASVKTVAGGREIHFISPEKLFIFLYGQLGAEGGDPRTVGEDHAIGGDPAGTGNATAIDGDIEVD